MVVAATDPVEKAPVILVVSATNSGVVFGMDMVSHAPLGLVAVVAAMGLA